MRTSIADKLAKARGSITRNTEVMRRMGTGKQQTSLAVRVLVAQAAQVIARVAPGEPVVQEALAGPAAQVVQEALAGPAAQVAQEALAELVVRVAQEGLAELVVLAVVEPEHDLGVAEPEQGIAPAEEVLGIVPVEEVRELDRPPARRAVAPRTKSVTAAHLHGLVPLLAVAEDLAAVVAVTTHEPAAVGVATAWEVADIAVVVAEDAAAEEAEDKQRSMEKRL
jgi:hypothetical protein